MIEYLIKTQIDGMEIRLIESQHSFAVVYGMQNKHFPLTEIKLAIAEYKHCVNHALECLGAVE